MPLNQLYLELYFKITLILENILNEYSVETDAFSPIWHAR